MATQFTPWMAGNPFLSGIATMRAAFSQDTPGLIYAAGGGPVPIMSYPQSNPFGNYLTGGTTLPFYQSLGFPQTYTGSTTGFGQIQIFPPGAQTGIGTNIGGIPTSSGLGGQTNQFGGVTQFGGANQFGTPQFGATNQFTFPQQQQFATNQFGFPQQQFGFPQQQQFGNNGLSVVPGQFSFLV